MKKKFDEKELDDVVDLDNEKDSDDFIEDDDSTNDEIIDDGIEDNETLDEDYESDDDEMEDESNKAMEEELENLKNYSLRLKADMENMKKRNKNIASDMYKEGKLETLLAILPVSDSLDRALSLDMDDKVKEGIDKIKKQFESIIEKLGVEEIKALGEVFDPNYHNALMQVEDAENSGKCVQVYEKGYKLGEKVLRHASVVVAK